jgi:hypothetical protein
MVTALLVVALIVASLAFVVLLDRRDLYAPSLPEVPTSGKWREAATLVDYVTVTAI